jgi:hypothetical protein
MKKIVSAIAGMTMILAFAGISFAQSAPEPAGVPAASTESAAPAAKAHKKKAKKHVAKKAPKKDATAPEK